MPAKENILLIAESNNQTKLIRKDVDNLVQNIKENLKLTQYEAASHTAGGVQYSAGPLPDSGTAAKPDCTSLKSDHYPSVSILTPLPDYPYPDEAGNSSSSFKARSYVGSRTSRASPYGVVPSKTSKCDCIEQDKLGMAGKLAGRTSWAARKRYPSMSANSSKQKQSGGPPTALNSELEDPLEMLHELISEGNLLKEAVRRLQLGLSPKIQRNFYDSDEDCRTPNPGVQHPMNNYSDLCELGIN